MKMKNKRIWILLTLLLCGICYYALWKHNTAAYPYLYVDENYYYVSNAPASYENIGEQIAVVSRNKSIAWHNQNGDSNALSVGTRIFTSTGAYEGNALICEDQEKVLRLAYPHND